MNPSWLLRPVCVLVVFLLVFRAGKTYAQTSNKGTDFWVAYTGHIDGTDSRLTLFITSEFDASVSIRIGNQLVQTVSIVANQSRAVTIDPTIYNVYVGSNDVVESDKAIHVSSDKPIAVYSHISKAARSAAALIFPTSSLGKEYYAISYTQLNNDNQTGYSEFTIVAIEDGTEIEIRPTQADIGNTHQANSTFSKILNKGQIYQYQSNTDVSGSYIRSKDCKPIAVFSGSSFTFFCENGRLPNRETGDNLYQQLLPVSAWGKNFVTAPFYNTENGNTDIFRVQVAEDNTTVTVNGSSVSANGVTLNNPYMKGSIITFWGTTPNVIHADKPISLAQFQTTQSCNLSNPQSNNNNPAFPGDPEMTILNPIEQTLKDITLYSAVSTALAPTSITKHFINVILKTADAPSLTIDGAGFSPGQFRSIDAEYSYIIVDVTNSSATNPSHRVKAAGGFVAIAYGYGTVESYGYLAGSDLKNLNKYLEVKKTDGQPAVQVCAGNSYEIKLNLPYITPSITWDFGNSNTAQTVNNPPYVTNTLNGETLYQYSVYLDPAQVSLAPGSTRFRASVINPSPLVCNAAEDVFLDLVVFPPPEPAFSAANTCLGTDMQFVNTSNLQGFTASSWLWDFGDGSTSNEENPKHTYAAPGFYPVTLTVMSTAGCNVVTSAPLTVQVYKKPEANFGAGNVCVGVPVTLSNLSTSEEGTLTTWLWDFGDGTSENRTSADPPQHAYTTAGNFSITLRVFDNRGCESLPFSKVVEVYPLPNVDFVLPGACVSDVVEFRNLSSISDSPATSLSYQWDFGDPASGANNRSILPTGYHKYSSAGIYQVTLKAVSATGCETVMRKDFTVNGSSPVADFTLLNGNSLCSTEEAMLENKSKVEGFGDITRLVWYFDYDNDRSEALEDTRPQSGKIQKYNYPVHHNLVPKQYNVRLEAYSGALCSAIKTQVIFVKGVPDVQLRQIAPMCAGDAPVRLEATERYGFTKQSEVFSGTGVSPSGEFNPAAAGPGLHQVTYVYTATNGCSDTATIQVEVHPLPVVNAGEDVTLLEGQSVKLMPSTTGTIAEYQWLDPTGLSASNIPDPVASPRETIVYRLQVKTDKGCIATDDVKITVLKDLIVPNAFSPNGDGVNDRWELPYLSGYPGCTVTVFNRLGRRVFFSIGYAEPWDGRLGGEEIPAGVYYYIIEPKNGRMSVTGYLTLLR